VERFCSPECRLRFTEPGEAEKESAVFLSRFLIAFVILFVAWVLGGFVFHVAGGLIHILLVVALIVLVVHFLRGRP
jgi:Family of unknown function (DUF5670)